MTTDRDRSEGDVNWSLRRRAWANAVGPEARRTLNADERVFLHQSLSTPCLTEIVAAQGSRITDRDGRSYLDFHGNSVHHIGHGHPRLIAALKQQMDELPFVPRRFTNGPAIALAEKLAEIAPGNLGKVLFAPGGSEAIEIAIKLARIATGRHKTISFWDAFHGAGFGAASVGGEALFRAGIGPLLSGTEHVAPFACYRCPYGHAPGGVPDFAECGLACANYLEYALAREGDVAAVIAEPMRSVPYLPPPGFRARVRAACDAHGALLIFDEIPCGLGKTGRMWASDHDDVVPDLMVTGKALGGGLLPIAAVIARPELDLAGDKAIGHYTHEKNPLLARAALTTIAIIEEEGLVDNAARLGERALVRAKEMQARHRLIGDVRGRGLMFGIELIAEPKTREPALDAADMILYKALEHGLSFKTTMGNVLTLSPPLNISDSDLDRALDILDDAITAVERDLP